jgi:hypothetical protein
MFDRRRALEPVEKCRLPEGYPPIPCPTGSIIINPQVSGAYEISP